MGPAMSEINTDEELPTTRQLDLYEWVKEMAEQLHAVVTVRSFDLFIGRRDTERNSRVKRC